VQLLHRRERSNSLELGFYMTLLRRLVVLGFFLAAAAPGAWAQTVAMANLNTLSAYGLTATITNCSATCAGDSLVVVPTGRGTITFEVLNTLNPLTSAILSTTTSATLTFDLVISANTSYHPLGSVVSNASLTSVGYRFCSGGGTACSAVATASFSAGTTATPLTDTLPTSSSTSTQVSMVNSPSSFSPASNSFTVVESLSLNKNGQTAGNLAFDSLALKLTTTPEPASIAVLLMALGGLVMARPRRRPAR
jgi:hypothetical protein